jgi:HTH-type transcriptional regulator/antitoxin MqsA
MTMAADIRKLPDTMISPETGEPLFRGVRPFEVSYKGETIVVDASGYYPEGEGDGVLVGDDMAPIDAALKALRQEIDGVPSPEKIKGLRSKLKLSQREAGALFKVGENAFDKYERGLVEPSGPTIQLMKLLDSHPELVNDLR